MVSRISILVFSIAVTLITMSGQLKPARAGHPGDKEVPLVLVNEDTVTTYDLRLELEIMVKMNPQSKSTVSFEPEKVLRRLIQNQLILQEGYRLEMDKTASVTNQVRELVRSKSMIALLDSVSLSVPPDSPDVKEARMKAVRSYIDGLKKTYSVFVDSTLLKSLDYASADPEVQEYLHDGTDVLVIVPTGKLTVARFSRILRFKEFHGLVGKPDAAARRDKILDEWIVEALLSHQVRIQGRDKDQAIQEAGRNLENVLVRQETIDVLLQSSYEPSENEIKQYYEANTTDFLSPVRVKMKSKKLDSEQAAQAFREKLLAGASIDWLAENEPGLVPGNDPFPYDWFSPEKLGLKPDEIKTGYIPEPYGVPGGWVVAVVSEIEEPAPVPLDRCRSKIVPILKSRYKQQTMADIMARLEDASEIKILPGAEKIVREILDTMN